MTFAGQVLRYQDIASDELTRGPVTDLDLHRARHDDHILPTRRIMKIRERRGRSLIDTNTSVSDFGGQRRKGIGIKVLEMRVIIGSCVDADDFHENPPARGGRAFERECVPRAEDSEDICGGQAQSRLGVVCCRRRVSVFSLDFINRSVQ
jgi:hypothetical protein